MAAIFGIVAAVPDEDLHAHARLLQQRMAYRAPDGFSLWRGTDAVLGQGSLHVGEPTQSQPRRLRDGSVCVVDGYVANHDQLARMLGVERSAGLDDAGLLALAIERWGPDFTRHAEGEFAAAVWDARSRRLQLYRDHLGARPICYAGTGNYFAFASCSLALAAMPGLSRDLNPLGIVTLWYDDAAYLDNSYTAFRAVHAVPPAHWLEWEDRGEPRVRRYWRLQPLEPMRLRDPREYVDAFQDCFAGAVTRSMRGSPATALMLSGGIDSGAILAGSDAFRRGAMRDDLICISAVLAPGHGDAGLREENANIVRMTAHRRKLQFSVPVVQAPGALVTPPDLAEAAWSFMHPSDVSLLVPALCCKLAVDAGCRLILNGVDGDVVTAPGGNHIAMAFAGNGWARGVLECLRGPTGNVALYGQSPAGLLARGLAARFETPGARRWRYRRRAAQAARAIARHPVMSEDLADAVDLPARLSAAADARTRVAKRGDHVAYWLALSLDANNRLTSRYGIEARHPWCDRRVLDYFQRLPVEFRVRDGWTKWVVRSACVETLGPEVAWHRGKRHLGALLVRQVLQDAAPYLAMLVAEQRQALQQYLQPKAIDAAIAQLRRGDLDNGAICDRLLSICALAGWTRHGLGLSGGS